MLLKSYEPEVIRPPCDYGREEVNVIAHLAEDISPVFPYLNALIAGAEFQPAANILRFRLEGHMVTMRPGEIAAGGFADADAAIEFVARLQKLINDTWERREEITPSFVQRKRLTPADIYRHLPKTNCKKCGQPTCFIFASKMSIGQANLADCPVLQEPAYAAARQALEQLVANAVFP